MSGLSTVLVVSIAITCVQSTPSVREIAEKKAATTSFGKFEQIRVRLQSIEERLQRIEARSDSAATHFYIQHFDSPIEYNVEWYVDPGQVVLPGQVVGRVVPRRGRTIVPWLQPGVMILDKTDGNFQRD